MNLNSPLSWLPAASAFTKMPSLPSSFLPTAMRSPPRTRRVSRTHSTPSRSITSAESIRGSRGSRHSPPMRTYVGRFVVEKKSSGRTPSAGAGTNRASGAEANRASRKSGCGIVVTGRKMPSRYAVGQPPGLEQAHRIAVERDAKLRLVLRYVEPLHEETARTRHERGVRALDEQMPTPARFHAVHRARRRTDDRDLVPVRRESAAQPVGGVRGEPLRPVLVKPREHDVREARHRRIRRLAATVELLRHEP